MNIVKIRAHEILDSRGHPTVEVDVELEDGIRAQASVPSGASTGRHEAYELRDGDEKRYGGKGVTKAVENVNSLIAPQVVGQSVFFQKEIDQTIIGLDKSPNKAKVGANAMLGVSLAVARAAAQAKKVELYEYLASAYDFSTASYSIPTPLFNIFNGGKHADTNLDFQEFQVIPFGIRDQGFAEMLRAGSEIFHELGKVLLERGFDTDLGDEGGYAPDMESSVQALDFIVAAMERAGYGGGKKVYLGMDVGSSVLYDADKGQYVFRLDRGIMHTDDLIGLYHEWLSRYPFLLIEDGLDEEDWEGWKKLTRELGENLILVGDDLFCTNVERIRRGIKEGAANAALIKPNQIGTLTETVEAIKLAQSQDFKVVVSHRSGETTDTFISDLAVASHAQFIKAGAPSRGERVAKYNRLLEIERKIS